MTELPPASPEVAEHNLAQLTGQSVALHLARVLPQLLQQVQGQPACVLCVQARKMAEAGHAEAPDGAVTTLPDVMPAVTWMPMGQPPVAVPLCYGHVPSGPQVRATGLIAPNGQPIVARQ